MALADRSAVIAALESVDAVISFDDDTPLDLIRRLQPDVLIKGADYTIETVVGAAEVEAAGGRVVLIELVEGHSTTATIGRLRQRARRRSPPTARAEAGDAGHHRRRRVYRLGAGLGAQRGRPRRYRHRRPLRPRREMAQHRQARFLRDRPHRRRCRPGSTALAARSRRCFISAPIPRPPRPTPTRSSPPTSMPRSRCGAGALQNAKR